MRTGDDHKSTLERSAGRPMSVMVLLLAGLVLSSGCTVSNPEIPPVTGPSELGLSLQLTAAPDVLPLDGASQSLIRIFARNHRGEPVAGLAVRLHIVTSRGFEDFGQLSTRSVVTGSDGRATATYTAPLGGAVDLGGQILIDAVPVGTNYGDALGRTVLIRLVPPGTVIPPANFSAGFTFEPAAPNEHDLVRFTTNQCGLLPDDCVSDPTGLVISYTWNFGDGSTGSGPTVTHAYARAGSYTVTLTIADAYSRTATATKVVTVGLAAQPAAAFRFSPEAPRIGEPVFFNASETIPAPGTQIVSYAWDFGDGSTGSGVTASHTYRAAGEYRVTLTVRDNRGATNSTSQPLEVEESRPLASFTFSPAAPSVGTTVFFNASASRAASGREIVNYGWNFGDGTTRSNMTTTHVFTQARTYTVTLTVTDNVGEIGVASQTVTVGGTGTGPAASFTVSPSPATVGTSVVVDATASTPTPGATIVAYTWNFGDSTTTEERSTPTHSHTYAAPGTVTITLTVRDSLGRTSTTTRTLTVS